ncbi:MAG: hypothetical protein V1872_10065 [bacterium]
MIVSNTTPLSNFLHLNNLSLLTKLFGNIYIPKVVVQEVDAFFSANKEWKENIEQQNIIIQSISNTIFVKELMPFLHQGEAEAISLCIEKKGRLLLLDDRDARTIAQRYNISISGTVGILDIFPK